MITGNKMAFLSAATLLAIAATMCTACGGGRVHAVKYENLYPDNISPPRGCQYSCVLTALPADLSGIPDTDKEFINHVYSAILRALQAKTAMVKALNGTSNFSDAYSIYAVATAAQRAKIVAEKPPEGLEEFKTKVVGAIDNQKVFFEKAQKMRQSGRSVPEIMQMNEGRVASQMLQAAWNEMTKRYQYWSNEVKDSMYHHLCALDLF